MKRNRKITQHAWMKNGSVGIISLIVTMTAIGLVRFSFNAKCTGISKEIGACEQQLKQLENELTRANMRWDEMKTPHRLENALVRFGIEMKYPNEAQIVRMDARGRPEPGQLSVARRQAARGAAPVALAGASSATRSATRTETSRRMKRHGRVH